VSAVVEESWDGSAVRAGGRAVARALSVLAILAGPLAELDEGRAAQGAQVEAVLRELGGPSAPPVEELAETLLGLGPKVVEPLFDALAAGALPAPRAAALESALRRLPGVALGALAGADPAPRERLRLVGLAVLARSGRARDLGLACDLAGAREPGETPGEQVVLQLERSARAILERDESAFAALRRVLADVGPAPRAALVNAVGATRSAPGLDLLSDLLGCYAGLDGPVLAQIARCAAALGPPFEWGLCLRVRAFLSFPDPGLRRAAALALGRMEDFESAPELIELLAGEERGVRDDALWALRRISGRRLGPDVERWTAWYDGEIRWWRVEAPRLLGDVAGGCEPEAVRALSLIARRRLFRHELARELIDTVDPTKPDIVRVTCSALQSLRSPVAVPGLTRLLGHEDAGVRLQAQRALDAIAGGESPGAGRPTRLPSGPPIGSRSAGEVADQ